MPVLSLEPAPGLCAYRQVDNMRPKSESLEPGLIIRLLVLLFVKARDQKYLRRLWKPSPGLMSVFNVCIKVKPFASLAEAHAMQFVARNTSVPVPKVYYAFVHKDSTYAVMSKIEGQMAHEGWQKRTPQSKAKILDRLRRMVAEYRSVPPPEGTGVGGVDGGPFCDCRLPTTLIWGPFATARDFHEALAGDIDIDADYAKEPSDASELFDFYRRSDSHVVLTHGDLSSLNILVKGDDVVGIIDWETAGWFPPYWEYACAKNVNPYNVFWADEVDSFLEPMPYELRMESIRQRCFGAF